MAVLGEGELVPAVGPPPHSDEPVLLPVTLLGMAQRPHRTTSAPTRRGSGLTTRSPTARAAPTLTVSVLVMGSADVAAAIDEVWSLQG